MKALLESYRLRDFLKIFAELQKAFDRRDKLKESNRLARWRNKIKLAMNVRSELRRSDVAKVCFSRFPFRRSVLGQHRKWWKPVLRREKRATQLWNPITADNLSIVLRVELGISQWSSVCLVEGRVIVGFVNY